MDNLVYRLNTTLMINDNEITIHFTYKLSQVSKTVAITRVTMD